MSLHTYLIEKNFLSGFLNETDDLSQDISNLFVKEDIQFSDISDFLVKMEGTDISDDLKLSYLKKLTRVYSEKVDDSLNETVEIFNEYAGNPKKNKALIRLMKVMEKNLQEFYDDTLNGIKSLDEMLKACKEEANKENFSAKQAAVKVQSIYKKILHDFESQGGRRDSYGKTFQELKNVCNSFGVRFNDVVMEDKKAFDVKLKAAFDKMANNEQFKSWMPDEKDGMTPKIKELNEYLDKLRMDNAQSVSTMIGEYIQPVYNYMYMCMTGYMGNINYLRKILGLEREDTIFYKAINKIFKTKKKK